MHEQLPASHEFHYEKDLLICLKNVLHSNQEWMVGFLQNLFFKQSGLNLIIVKNDILTKGLHGKDASRVRFFNKEHFTKTSFSDNTFDLEVFQLCRLFRLLPLEKGI